MNARILVVDDDPAISEMIGIILHGEGYEPIFAADGKQLAIVPTRESAIAVARQNDLEPLSVH